MVTEKGNSEGGVGRGVSVGGGGVVAVGVVVGVGDGGGSGVSSGCGCNEVCDKSSSEHPSEKSSSEFKSFFPFP